MPGSRCACNSLLASIMLATVCAWPTAVAADDEAKTASSPAAEAKAAKKDAGKVSGIAIDRGDHWMTVKADGEAEPIKYVIDPDDTKLKEAINHVFNAARVQLTYKQVGDTRQLTSLKRHIIKQSGTITGEVVKVYNDFWVEVKPKTGLADAFAPGGNNYNDKAFMAQLRGLKPGDSVTIQYTTDFERHRIQSLRKNPARKVKPETPPPTESPAEK
ncbi:MAG TPA: hypothetical protein VFI31_03160 [Pirellulales bacterium]|nr:hypothetical protein [Pirellulales bacterium]